jgi:16S rRNA (uracil1498-N3)-methyltransferase
LGDGRLNEARGRIINLSKKEAEVEILEIGKNQNEPRFEVNLYCAILKRENFEFVVQKATEVGVRTIIPLITQRTVKKGLRSDRLIKIIKEAAEQAGRGIVPKFAEAMDFKKAMEVVDLDSLNLIFDASGNFYSQILKNAKAEEMNIFIGPEGGWEEKELELAEEHNFQIMSLGKLTLRSETAAVIATYLAINL